MFAISSSQWRWEECVDAFDTDNFGTVVRFHLEELPSFATACDDYGITLLHYAAAKGDRDLISILLGLGADRSARNRLGDTPRDDAVSFNQHAVLDLLTDDDYYGGGKKKKGKKRGKKKKKQRW